MKRYKLLFLFMLLCLGIAAQVGYITDSAILSNDKGNVLCLEVDNLSQPVGYIIQKSEDGQTYQDFRTIMPAKDARIKSYMLEDNDASRETYYKVWEIRPDKTLECDPVKVVNELLNYKVPVNPRDSLLSTKNLMKA